MENIKAKFLWDLGIRKDNYPASFLEKIQDMSKMLSTTELGYCALQTRCDGKSEEFCIRDVVGTNHQRYAGRTWVDAFLDLDRGDNIIKLYQENPGYWEEMKSLDNAEVGLLKHEGKYYIFDKAGGGNNRIITMKMRYLSLIHQAGENQAEIERINSDFTFAANVRELPKDNIVPFIVVALEEDLRGVHVIKQGEEFIVQKKFTDMELFRGSGEELKGYFKSLFDQSVYGEQEVKEKLRKIQIACGFCGGKYKEVLEGMLPQLKEQNLLDER